MHFLFFDVLWFLWNFYAFLWFFMVQLMFFTISICFSDCVWLCFCFWNLLSPFRILLQKCLIWRVLFLSVFTKNHCYYTRRMSSPTLCVVSKPVKLCNAPHGGTDTHTRISKHSGSIPETLKFTATSIFEMRGWRFYMPNHSSGPHALHCQKKAEQLTHRCSRYKRPNHFHLLTYYLTVSILADRIHSKSARLKPRLPKDCLQRSFTSPLCGASNILVAQRPAHSPIKYIAQRWKVWRAERTPTGSCWSRDVFLFK